MAPDMDAVFRYFKITATSGALLFRWICQCPAVIACSTSRAYSFQSAHLLPLSFLRVLVGTHYWVPTRLSVGGMMLFRYLIDDLGHDI